METNTYKQVNNLWELPDCGKIVNPYFVQLRRDSDAISYIEVDDTDSVNTPSTTDESDDSLNNDQSKVNGTKKKKRAKKQVVKDQTIGSEQEKIDASTTVNKAKDESEIIPGIDSPKLTTTIILDKPKCCRIGCCDAPVENPDWDFEYCSSKCAVQHCKIAFTNWVIARQLELISSTTTTPSSTVTTATN